jgi:excisionase family DNA binding protein
VSNATQRTELESADRPWRVGQAAEFLRVSSDFLYRRIAAGEVKSSKIGRVVLVPSAEVERLAKGVS